MCPLWASVDKDEVNSYEQSDLKMTNKPNNYARALETSLARPGHWTLK